MKPEEYILDLYDPDDRIALVLVPRAEGGKTQQRIWTAGKAASDKVQKWLRHANAQGFDIYIGMNPIRAGAASRYKKDIAEVRRVYLDLDQDGQARVSQLLEDSIEGRIPGPSYIVNTSKDRFQVIWNVKAGELGKPEAESLMRGLADAYGGDRAATDVSRVLRLPGFKHRGRNSWIKMSATGKPPCAKKDWPPQLFVEREPLREPHEKPLGKQGSSPRRGGGDTSPSGKDWGRTRDSLRKGETPDAIEDEIRARRTDKHNPADYARRTVQRAAESLSMER